MQQRRIVTTGAIEMQTVEFQQGFETGLNGGLCGGYRCEIAQEGWLSEELLRRDAGQIVGWIIWGTSVQAAE